jgi:hypothetical protein
MKPKPLPVSTLKKGYTINPIRELKSLAEEKKVFMLLLNKKFEQIQIKCPHKYYDELLDDYPCKKIDNETITLYCRVYNCPYL